ncbi:cytochrome b/b6 domain-containing protein [Ralstonia solanacearum]|uniref:cytochrome b/b6 domain-containing protein n=1 Tax=Ralstonia solanacearum TaxID=305 RepID=UPI00078DEF2F|nr:cytochrome b/b6 domain-containing protein [Ralstonia solanacearum]AMP38054.1 cytochrome B [Ralstonia solanacearum]AXV86881.1 cytochrome b/b6 domain-containing protein [Ralstonia solanacearum]AXW06377.1 cytochrome b/b6 domain-containing protein [Ralstonia solanacearum]AXW24121.1 cytochrome b/b6 domain-containing protein [Ralstonia solanacearum]AXW81055.1 cytochrome b/b6 domain-containing protein [Ralstonia solanacearum]
MKTAQQSGAIRPKPRTSLSATLQPAWLRITHWLNAIAVIIMMLSGWRIYNASPLFAFRFPNEITLGGWLAGALQWHFAAMWLLVANGLVYLVLNVATGRFWRRFIPVSIPSALHDVVAALRGRLSHANLAEYNAAQKLLYLGVVAVIVITVLSGLAIWKSVQFPLLRTLMGGYDAARWVHFIGMSAIALFIVVHVVMTVLVPRTLIIMLRGR